MKDVFTTGQVAKLCSVTHPVVIDWIDSGKLPGYRVPGSKDRRVSKDKLLKFMRDNDIPLGVLASEGAHRVLLIGPSCDDCVTALSEHLSAAGCDTEIASTAFEAGFKIAGLRPDCVAIDCSIGRTLLDKVLHWIRDGKAPIPSDTPIIGLVPSGLSAFVTKLGCDLTVQFPYDSAVITKQIVEVIEEKKKTAPEPFPRAKKGSRAS